MAQIKNPQPLKEPHYTMSSQQKRAVIQYSPILLPQHQREGKVYVMRKGFIGYYKPTQKELVKLMHEDKARDSREAYSNRVRDYAG